MDLLVLNTNLEVVQVVDVYESFIWTDRYNRYGDFELYTAMSNDILAYMQADYYIRNRDSEHVMIIEHLHIASDVENGNHLTITGRSLESILDRRIVWGLKTLTGNLQTAIQTLLNENVISPSDNNRKISNFIFETSTDEKVTKLTIDAQYTGDNLYDIVSSLCIEHGIGFKITLNDNNQFVFKLYAGSDRSYRQETNPYVVFSPDFENIINSDYDENKSALKTITLIGGEGEGSARRYTTSGLADSGLERREMFTDARDISSDVTDENGESTKLSDEEYVAQLKQRGKENLEENIEVLTFEGKTETSLMFVYGTDFFNGDIVQIKNEYGHEATARITEIISSEDKDGSSLYPTFEIIKEGETT